MTRKQSIQAWFIWTVSAVFFFYKYVLEVSPSVMTQDLMRAFHIGGSDLGHLASSYFYAYTLMQAPVGLLLDRYGPRRITTLAIILCGTGACFFASSDHLWTALLSRFMIGLGASFSAVNIFKLSANWFPSDKFAFMVGLSMTLGMLGAVGGEEPLAAFIHFFTWRPALYYLGIFGILLSGAFFLIVRDSPKKIQKVEEKSDFWTSLKEIANNPQNWMISVYSGLLFAPIAIFGGLWGVPFLQEAHGLSKEISARIASLIFIGFAIGAPFFGWLSDRIGKRKPLMLYGTIASFIIVSLIVYYPHLPLSLNYLSTFLLGISLSTFLISFTVIREYNSPLVTGTAIGIMNTFNALFVAIANPLIGKLLDLGWDGRLKEGAHAFSVENYQLALITLPLYCLVGWILLYFIKETNCKPVN